MTNEIHIEIISNFKIFTDLENKTHSITFVAFSLSKRMISIRPIWQYQATLIPQGHLNLINNIDTEYTTKYHSFINVLISIVMLLLSDL